MKILLAIVAVFGCMAAVIGGAVLVMRGDAPDPHAYPGSSSGVSFAEAQEVSAIALPECAQETAKFHQGPSFVDAVVVMDFTAPDECVAEFLAGVGIDGNTPVVRWKQEFTESGSPIVPPVNSGITWTFSREDRVEYWRIERSRGVYEKAVMVVVNRSAQPQHVYIESLPSN
ncbi:MULTISPECIES: hypothetical protein [unclassified Saccharothrix]|uniref:hypothetical protein n=1 Tax=unclassified Saccharothrix TaxID=2593673 RepID=UPI00307E4A4A